MDTTEPQIEPVEMQEGDTSDNVSDSDTEIDMDGIRSFISDFLSDDEDGYTSADAQQAVTDKVNQLTAQHQKAVSDMVAKYENQIAQMKYGKSLLNFGRQI